MLSRDKKTRYWPWPVTIRPTHIGFTHVVLADNARRLEYAERWVFQLGRRRSVPIQGWQFYPAAREY